MFNFDLGSVYNRLLGSDLFGFDLVIKNDVSSGINNIINNYYSKKDFVKKPYKSNVDSLKKELSIARESVRRLNRRFQKFEKENNNLKKDIKKLKKEYNVNCKSLIQKESQVSLLVNNLRDLHKEAKAYSVSLVRWKNLSKLLFAQQFYGNVVTYPAEEGMATVYVLKNNKILDKCERIQIKSGTPVHCIKQDTRYVLIDFIKNGDRKRGYIPANNIRLSNKPCKTKLINSANLKKPSENNSNCQIITGVSAQNDNNIDQKKK